MHTEKEIMKLPCPLFSIGSLFAMLGDRMQGIDDKETVNFFAQGCMCRGSGCPMWEWVYPTMQVIPDDELSEIDRESLKILNDSHVTMGPKAHFYKRPEKADKGRCGLKR